MLFNDYVLNPFINAVSKYGRRNAFCIKDVYYSYKDLVDRITAVRESLIGITGNKSVGLVANDDIDTYASIFAIWMEGMHYIPLHPSWPIDRCKEIISQVGITIVLDSSSESRFEEKKIYTSRLKCHNNLSMDFVQCDDDEIAYILFTSGSTGKPKGVQLSRKNLSSFVEAFFDVYEIGDTDKCLQCFDLSFDLSIMSYLIPLLRGACVYTVPFNVIKYSFIGGLIEDEGLTVALMAPSTIKYLKPYFDEIDCTSLKLSLFCGEALPLDVTKEWAKCASNATIDNVYGPTEDTIFCSIYRYNREDENKAYNGILSIGKPMKGCGMAIFDDNKRECSVGTLGELCLSGNQLTKGYHKNEEKNKEAFFEIDGVRWYRTGDLCFKDVDGDFMYSGRLDHQAKIQGFRVELGEIEYHAKTFLGDKNIVCIAFENSESLTEIAMFIEAEEFNPEKMIAYMRTKMPSYMIPTRLYYVPVFPLNANDKTDKVKLKAMIEL